LFAAELDDQQQAENEAKRGHEAVRGQAEISDVKETGKHFSIVDAEAGREDFRPV